MGATVTVHTKLSPNRAFPVKVAELVAPRRITKSIPDLKPAFDEFARCLKTAGERSG